MIDMKRNRQFSLSQTPTLAGVLLWVVFGMARAQTAPEAAPTSPAVTQAQATAPVSQSWQQLSPLQKQALAPLGAQWSALTAQQQSKWQAISRNFSQLSVSEQITMHARMADWVALSPRQRNQARFNYNTVQKSLPKVELKAKWEAYQALPAEEKRQLSAGAPAPANSAAPTARPVESHRLVQTPQRTTDSTRDVTRPATSVIDRKTLLPRPPALAAPALPSSASEAVPSEAARTATETAPS